MIGVGIVGLGTIGTIHARALRDLTDRYDSRLVAYSGGRPTAADEAGWPTAEQLTPAEVIAHPAVDVVAICTPNHTHADVARAVLTAGRHAVVEKPLALTVADAEELAALATERDLRLSMIAQRRFEPEHVQLKGLLDSGRLGDVRLATTHVHWWRDDEYYRSAAWRAAPGGGSLMNQGVHNVDLIRWLCGPVAEVTAQYATLGHDIEAEDTTVATVRFSSGALGLVSTSTATPPGEPARIALHCAGGSIELGQDSVLRWDVDGVPAPQVGDGPQSGAADPVAIGHLGHTRQWRDILTAVRDGRPVAVGAEDAVETVRLLCAIYQAAATGQSVTL